MKRTKKLEEELGYHDYKVWKNITENIEPEAIEKFLSNKSTKTIINLLSKEPKKIQMELSEDISDLIKDDAPNIEAELLFEKVNELHEALGYHAFKEWKKICSRIPPEIVFRFINENEISLLITKIENQPDQLSEELVNFFEAQADYSLFQSQLKQMPEQKLFEPSGLSSFGQSLLNEFKQKTKKVLANRMKNEIEEYIEVLKNADDEEVAIALVAAVDFRNRFLDESGFDLFEPRAALAEKIDLTLTFSRRIEKLQAIGETYKAVPLLIWAHTLRASQTPQIRKQGREMWGELQRGLDYTSEAVNSFEMIMGKTPNLTDLNKVPNGLKPRTIQQKSSSKLLSLEEQAAELEKIKELYSRGLLSHEVYLQKQRDIIG